MECLSKKDINEKKIAIEIKDSQKRTLDDKVRDFLSKIYSEYVHLINKKNDNLVTQNDFVLLKQENIKDTQLAYKIAYSQLELMLLSQQESELQKQQLIYYHQDECLEKEENSDNLFFIPKVEITLNRSFVNPKIATKIPVQYSKTRLSLIISKKETPELQRISNVQRYTQKQTEKQSIQTNQINIENIKQSHSEHEPSLKKKTKISLQKEQDERLLNQENFSHQNKETLKPLILNESVFHQKDSYHQFSSNSQTRREIQQQRKTKLTGKSEDYKNIYSLQKNNNDEEKIQSDDLNQKVKKSKNFNVNQEFNPASSFITSNRQKSSSNKNFLIKQHQKIQDFQNFEQQENQVSEQSPFQSSQIKSQLSNIDYMNTEPNTLQINNNQNMNISQINNQQATHTLIRYDQKVYSEQNPYQCVNELQKEYELNEESQIQQMSVLPNKESQQKIKTIKKQKQTSNNQIFISKDQVDQNSIQNKEDIYQNQDVNSKIETDVNNNNVTQLQRNYENQTNIHQISNPQQETNQHHPCLYPIQHYPQQFYQQLTPYNQMPLNNQPMQFYMQPPQYQQMQIFPVHQNNYQPIIFSLPPNHIQHIN